MCLRVGIVGCGKIADGHAEEISRIPGASLVSVCDIEPLMAEQLGVRYGIAARYADFDRMLASESLDVVHITTPPQSHPALAMKAMDAGCHLFVEKPFALNAAVGRTILDQAERTRRKVSINYWYNFEPHALELRRMFEQGALGDVVHVESYFGYSLAGDFGTALLSDPGHWVHRLPGKLFHNVLDHIVNKITLFMPDEAPEITAVAWRRRPASGDPVIDGVLDELRFLVRGAAASGYGTFCAHAQPLGHFLRVYGTRNTAHADFEMRTVTVEPRQTIPSSLGRLFPAFAQARQYRKAAWRNVGLFLRNQFPYFAGMRKLITMFYDSIRHDAPLPISYAEILRVMAIMDGVVAEMKKTRPSQETGQP